MRLVSQADIDSYSVAVTCVALGYDYSVTAVPGQSITIGSLEPGSYEIDIEAYDGTVLIMSGSAVATVNAGATATAEIELSYVVGELGIDLTLPDDPASSSTWWQYGFWSQWNTRIAETNAFGVITKITHYGGYDDPANLTYTETFTIDGVSGLRTGSVVTDSAGDTILISTINHDTDDCETSIVYYDPADGTTVQCQFQAAYNADKSFITDVSFQDATGTEISGNMWNDDGSYKGKRLYGGLNYLVSCYYYEDIVTGNPVKQELLYNNVAGTNLPERVEHWEDDVLIDYYVYDVTDSGFYNTVKHYLADGTMLHYGVYQNPVDLGDYYSQVLSYIAIGNGGANDVHYGNAWGDIVGGDIEPTLTDQFIWDGFNTAANSNWILLWTEDTLAPGIIDTIDSEYYIYNYRP